MFIDIDKINIKDIKFDDIAVISQFISPINPVIDITAYSDVNKGIITHLKFLKIKNKMIFINMRTDKLKVIISFFTIITFLVLIIIYQDQWNLYTFLY